MFAVSISPIIGFWLTRLLELVIPGNIKFSCCSTNFSSSEHLALVWVWVTADNRWTQADYICWVSLWLFFVVFFVEQEKVAFLFLLDFVRFFLSPSLLSFSPMRCRNAVGCGARLSASWLKRTRCVRSARPAPPVPAVMSLLPRWLDTQARSVAKPGRCVRGLLVLLPYPPDSPHPPTHQPPSIFEMPPPFSPTVLSLSHHPVPFPSELTAICALRNTPHLFLPSTFLLCILTRRMLPRGVLQLFHVTDPPNKPTLVHIPPPFPLLFDKISSEGRGGNTWEDLCWFGIESSELTTLYVRGWKLWLLILIHSVTGVISTELS